MLGITFYLAHMAKNQHNGRFVSFWTCGHCGGGVVCEGNERIETCYKPKQVDGKEFVFVFPELQSPKVPKHTPENIASAFITAKKNLLRCIEDAPDADLDACAIMTRRALEMAVIEQGGTGNTLYAKIKDLATRNILAPALIAWAHEVRLIGNAGAHEEEGVTRKDAEQIVYFAEMFFTYIYTLPGEIAQRRQGDGKGATT